jgi:hypothetical protein
MSMCDASPREGDSRGHSAMYHSHDNRVRVCLFIHCRYSLTDAPCSPPPQLIVKTLTREEVARFHANFPAYHAVRLIFLFFVFV